jgi:pimeloyl-ACP methyl ester carboxylesterase
MNRSFAIDAKLIIEMQCLRPFEILGDIHASTVVIHGQADSMVPFAISKKHIKSLDHVRLVGIPHMDHGFTDQDDETGNSEASQHNFKRIVDEVHSQIRGRHEY